MDHQVRSQRIQLLCKSIVFDIESRQFYIVRGWGLFGMAAGRDDLETFLV